jgi:hypothetical protein
MKIDVLKSTFALMFVGMLSGAFLSQEGFSPVIIMAIGHFFSIPFMVAGIVELNNSDRIDKKEKTMWTFGFIALTFITAILYFASERKNVVPGKLS